MANYTDPTSRPVDPGVEQPDPRLGEAVPPGPGLAGLQAQVARTHDERRLEARRAEGIVEEEIQSFAGWLGTLEVLPTVAALREQADDLVDQLLAENENRWEHLTERDEIKFVLADRADYEWMRATVRELPLSTGNTFVVPPYFSVPRGLQVVEGFKLKDGMIYRIEMTLIETPYGNPPPWPDAEGTAVIK